MGDRDNGLGTIHICRVNLIRTSDSPLFLVDIIYPPVFERWLTHSVISHLHLEVLSEGYFPVALK